MVRSVRHPITPSLMKQKFDDVLEEFFNLEPILIECDKSHIRNYVTIRLVTVIEQFFRKIVEAEISSGNTKGIPKDITIQTQDLDKINEITKSIVISTSYTFQSVNAIKQSMNEYGITGLFDDRILEQKIDQLMSSRHDTVHTVISNDYDVSEGYSATESLIRKTLYNSTFGDDTSFIFSKGNYLLELNNMSDAIHCYNDVIRLKPDKGAAYNNKGNSLGALEKHEDAIKCYEKSKELEKHFA